MLRLHLLKLQFRTERPRYYFICFLQVNKPKQEPEQNKMKRPAEAKDAKEVAKKLLKTGAMKAIKKSLEKEKSKVEIKSFNACS